MSIALRHPATLGLVLAGGRARRMGGGDKALIEIAGITMAQRVVTRLRGGCHDIVLNANGDPARFARIGLPVVADSVPDFAGPLAGILAGLDFAAAHTADVAWVLSAPADCPFLPHDLVFRLHEARQNAGLPLACARSDDRCHPAVALWPVALRADLRRAVIQEGLRKVREWTARYGVALAPWPATPFDPFFNVNTPEDVSKAQRIARHEINA